jgi:uncharacterized protein (DUF2384 family)
MRRRVASNISEDPAASIFRVNEVVGSSVDVYFGRQNTKVSDDLIPSMFRSEEATGFFVGI